MSGTVNNHYILILCGGSGPRLWPLSRSGHPKQFLSILSKDSFLRETFLRAQKIVPRDHIFVISHQKYNHLIKSHLKGLLSEHNLISEPDKKNTAMAILYASSIISQINPQAVISSFTSDHYIGNLPVFVKQIKKSALIAAGKPIVVTLGIVPNSPSVSFGYILVGHQQQGIYTVKNFIEKPPLATAEKLIRSGKSYWNSGIYTFNVQTILSEFKSCSPKYYDLYQKIISSPKDIPHIYSLSPSLPLDIAISEKSKNIVMLAADFVWNDVGEWKSIYRQLSIKTDKVIPLNQDTEFLEVDSKKCLVLAPKGKLVGLVDVNNLAIIDTPDGLLVCNIAYNGSYKVRELVAKMVSDSKFKKYFLSQNDQ